MKTFPLILMLTEGKSLVDDFHVDQSLVEHNGEIDIDTKCFFQTNIIIRVSVKI